MAPKRSHSDVSADTQASLGDLLHVESYALLEEALEDQVLDDSGMLGTPLVTDQAMAPLPCVQGYTYQNKYVPGRQAPEPQLKSEGDSKLYIYYSIVHILSLCR